MAALGGRETGRKHAAGSWLPLPGIPSRWKPESHFLQPAGTASTPSSACHWAGCHRRQLMHVLDGFVVEMSSALFLLSYLRLITACLRHAMHPHCPHRCCFHVDLCFVPPGLRPWRNPSSCVLEHLATDLSVRDSILSFLPFTWRPQLGHCQE